MLFKYQAYNQASELKEGQIDALSSKDAIVALQRQELFISTIEPVGWDHLLRRWHLKGTVSSREIVLLSRQLSALFAAQVSVLEIFRMLAEDTDNQAIRKILNQIADDVQQGQSISDSLAKHPKIFSSFYVNMVRAGEESGTLDSILLYLADYQERNHSMTAQAKQSLVYPILVIVAAIGVMIMTFTIINNHVVDTLREANEEIPLFTELVLGVSEFSLRYGPWLLVLLAIFGLFFYRWYQTPHGRLTASRIKIELPIFGPLYKKLYLSRIADTLYTMISSGVQVIRTLEIASDVVNNRVYKDILEETIIGVRKGETLSEAFAKHPEITPAMVQITKVGEETGSLAEVLKTLAEFYRRDFLAAIKSALNLIQPVMIIFLGIWVAIIMLAIIVPIYSIATAL